MDYPYKLVRRGTNRGKATTVRQLTDDECALINGVEHNTWNDPTFREYQAKLKQWKAQEYWLSCECHPNAVLYLRQGKSSIVLHARSDSQYHAHDAKCDYIKETNTAGDKEKKDGLPKAKKDHNFIKSLSKSDPEVSRPGQSKRTGTKENPLFNLMKRLLIAAELDVIKSGARPMESQARSAVKAAAAKLTLGGANMEKALFFYPNLPAMDRALKELSFNKKAVPHVLTWWLVENYRKPENGPLEVLVRHPFAEESPYWFPLPDTRLMLHHTRGRSEQMAVLMLIYTPNPNGGGNYFPRGYLAPLVSSNHWFVVDSEYERRVAIKGRQAMEEATDIPNLILQKPLAERSEVIDGQAKKVIPDFVFRVDDTESVIEVMGTKEPEYVARKERLKPYMEAIGAYTEIDATKFDDNRKREQYYYSCCKQAIEKLRTQDATR